MAIALPVPAAFARANGIIGLTSDSVTGCNACHSDGSTPIVTLSGPTNVGPGDSNEYRLEVFEIGSQDKAGLDVGATGGSLAVGGSASSLTQLLNGEITHTNPKASDGTKTSFSFLWTAPLVNGMATLRGWGNAVNGNGTVLGDLADYVTLDVQVGATPTPTETPTVTPTPTVTATPTPIQHDVVMRPRAPLSVHVTDKTGSVTKTFSVKVRNADPPLIAPVTLQVTQSNDCPVGVTISQPDFKKTGLNTVDAKPGQTKAGKVSVSVAQGAFIGFNHLAPNRCTVTFTASHPLLPMNIDPSPSNNVTMVEINVFDASDPAQNTGGENVVRSRPPVLLTIPKNKPSPVKKPVVLLTNADVATETNSVTLAIDVTQCPWLTATVDADPVTSGMQPSVLVRGGKTVRGKVALTADPMQVDTPNAHAPLRCIAPVTATGTTNPDPVPSNNVTQLVIDILDNND